MKKIHGNIITFLLLLAVELSAVETPYCNYSISSSKSSAVLYEPVNINLTVHQKTKNEVMFFDLKPKSNDAYEIISIKEKRHEFNYHNAKKDFEYLLIPKKAGTIKVAFDLQVRRASDDAVAQAYRGSRDNVKSIPTIKVDIGHPSITLRIDPLKKEVDAVGDFTLVVQIDKSKTDLYGKVNVVYKLQGNGYLSKDFEPLAKIQNLSIFRGKKEKKARALENGYLYDREWSYAIVASEDYTIPKVTLKTYNYHTKRYIDKSTEEQIINVIPLDVATLLDNKEFPKGDIEYETYLLYFYNLLIFISGFIAAKLLEYLPKKTTISKESPLKIKNTKTAKELLYTIMPYSYRYELEKEIKILEELSYLNNSKKDFVSIKTQILKKINTN